MSISTRKITTNDILTKGVQAMPDRPSGTATENKQDFDKFATEVLLVKINGLIDDLLKQTVTSGAENIGCKTITGLNGGVAGSVYDMLDSLKTDINDAVVAGLSEGTITEAFLTADAVMQSLLTDYAISTEATPAALAATDKVVEALGKLEKLISNEQLKIANLLTYNGLLNDPTCTKVLVSATALTAFNLYLATETKNFTVYWGDGDSDAYTVGGTKQHTYAETNTYWIVIYSEDAANMPVPLVNSQTDKGLYLEAYLSDYMTSTGNRTFEFCQNLRYVKLPKSLQTIGSYSFSLTAINEIVLPSSLTLINTEAFKDSSDLYRIHYLGSKNDWAAKTGVPGSYNINTDAFSGVKALITQKAGNFAAEFVVAGGTKLAIQ